MLLMYYILCRNKSFDNCFTVQSLYRKSEIADMSHHVDGHILFWSGVAIHNLICNDFQICLQHVHPPSPEELVLF